MPGNHYDLPKDPVDAYLQTALFTDRPDNSSDGSDESFLDAGYSVSDFTPEARAEAAADLAQFLALCGWLGIDPEADGNSAADAASNFWYTRNHHGVGFWDGDFPTHGDALTVAAHAFPELFAWLDSESGKIFFERA